MSITIGKLLAEEKAALIGLVQNSGSRPHGATTGLPLLIAKPIMSWSSASIEYADAIAKSPELRTVTQPTLGRTRLLDRDLHAASPDHLANAKVGVDYRGRRRVAQHLELDAKAHLAALEHFVDVGDQRRTLS